MKSKFVEGGGGDHFTVAVEIEQTEIKNHPMAMKEVQEISILPKIQYEKTRVIIENPDDKDYILSFKTTKDLKKIYPSSKIKGKASG